MSRAPQPDDGLGHPAVLRIEMRRAATSLRAIGSILTMVDRHVPENQMEMGWLEFLGQRAESIAHDLELAAGVMS